MLTRICRKLKYSVCYIVSWPIAFFLLCIAKWYPVRLVFLFSDRIGHFALNTELMLTELQRLGGHRCHYYFFTCDASSPICNQQLLKMWKRTIPIMPMPILASHINQRLIKLSASYRTDPIKRRYEQNSGDRDTQGFLSKFEQPVLHFEPVEEQFGSEQLVRLGIPAGQPYVCLSVRDSGYLEQHMPGQDWSYHCFRDADIDCYEKAVRYLAEKGYYVIRMGKFVSKPFIIDHPRVIDYANHDLRSDFLDIYLAANCTFFMSTSSGLDAVAQAFRRPILYTNIALPIELQTQYPGRLFIPKKLCDQSGVVKTFQETYAYFASNSNKKVCEVLAEYKLHFVENTSDEILEAVQEMLDLLEDKHVETEEEKKAQHEFWRNCPKQPSQFCERAKSIRIGKAYLTRYPYLQKSLKQEKVDVV